jgi:hypothetical protein
VAFPHLKDVSERLENECFEERHEEFLRKVGGTGE